MRGALCRNSSAISAIRATAVAADCTTGPPHTFSAMLTVAKREPSAFLLAGQLAALLVYPLLNGSAGRAAFSIVGIALLGLVVRAVHGTPGLTTVAIVLALPASVLLLIQAVTDSDDLLPYSSALEAILYFYAAGALIAWISNMTEAGRARTSATAVSPGVPWTARTTRPSSAIPTMLNAARPALPFKSG